MAITVVIYGGAVWNHCNLAEVECFSASSYEDAEERLVEHLRSLVPWMSPERAQLTARRLLDGETVLIGWEYGFEILSEPPEGAEEYDLSRYGDPVYVLHPDTVLEPHYMCVEVFSDE
jgi:hypothetical protein